VYVLMIRPLQKRAFAATIAELPVIAPVSEPVDLERAAELASEAKIAERSLVLKKQLTDFVKAEPESSTTAVRAWLREEAR